MIGNLKAYFFKSCNLNDGLLRYLSQLNVLH